MIYQPSPSTEATIRLGFFLGVFGIMALLECIIPKRKRSLARLKRWPSNFFITFLDAATIRFLFPAAAIGVSVYAAHHQIGLLNFFTLPAWLSVLVSVIILDLVIYFQHVIFHFIPALWRVHRVHHVDLDIDVTTGFRFHPIEILLSMLIKFTAILLLGIAPLAVIIFEVVLNALAMFNHSNIHLPKKMDEIVRKFIVTPDMHRVHHSDIMSETNSNFGFNLSLWDKIFGTYCAEPTLGHDKMHIGVKTIRAFLYCTNLLGMIWLPFVKKTH